MTTIFFPVVLGMSWFLIVLLCLKLYVLESEFKRLLTREEITDKEIEQLSRDVDWLKEMKTAGKLY